MDFHSVGSRPVGVRPVVRLVDGGSKATSTLSTLTVTLMISLPGQVQEPTVSNSCGFANVDALLFVEL